MNSSYVTKMEDAVRDLMISNGYSPNARFEGCYEKNGNLKSYDELPKELTRYLAGKGFDKDYFTK